MNRDRLMGILVVIFAALTLYVSIGAMREGKRIGEATARIKALNLAMDSALERERAAERREKVWRDSAARAHAAGVQHETEFRRRVAGLVAAAPIVITDTAQVRAALASRDSTIYVADSTIRDKNKELADRDKADAERATKELEAENRYRALERINTEMKALVPSRTSKVITAAKWIGVGVALGRAVR